MVVAELKVAPLVMARELPEMEESKVAASVTLKVPLNRVAPRTPKVVVGVAVPMPTLPSLALTTNVEVSTTNE